MTLEIPPAGTRGVTMPGGAVFRSLVGVHVALYRLLGGRLVGGGSLLLTTTGARTGRERTVAIARFPDGDGRWLVVGSAAGAARHPAWFINLAKNPKKVRVQVGPDRFAAIPEVLAGDERRAAWDRIVAAAPGFARYADQTDREIPIVRLTRRQG